MFTKLCLVCALIAYCNVTLGSSICDPLRSPVALEPQLQNCEMLVRGGLVPNRDALRYTIRYMVNNYRKIQHPACAINGIRRGDFCSDCQRPDWIESGLENNCSFVINDLQRPWRGQDAYEGRTTGYFVDLCATSRAGLVSTFYFNGASGEPFDDRPREYLDTAPSNSSILAGAFLLSGEMHNDFDTERSEYNTIKSRYGGVPAIRMVGLNSSNNTTEFDKPLHVSVFGRGKGCPGVSESTLPTMRRIVSRGRSLYMAYAGQRFEQPADSCVNDSSDTQIPSESTDVPRRAVASVEKLNQRFIFEFPRTAGTIRKMQVDLIEEKNLVMARTKNVDAAGKKSSVLLLCLRMSVGELNCRRSDNGGSFNIAFSPTPRISIGYYSADGEESEVDTLVLKSSKTSLLIVEGKKAVLTKSDAF